MEKEEEILPTRSYQADTERREEEEAGEDIVPGLRSGLITLTHSVFTISRAEYEETLTSLAELVAVSRLMRTRLGTSDILFAHSEWNNPVAGITVSLISRLVHSHWSRASECCWRQQSSAIKNQLVAPKAPY